MKIFTPVLFFLVIQINAQEKLLPEKQAREDLIDREAYVFSYNEGYELASWTWYELTPEEAKAAAEPSIKAKPDPDIFTKTATMKDYKKTGYSPGQLIPSDDFTGQNDALTALNYFSTLAPMKPGFYTMTWRNLEKLIRAWSIQNEVSYQIVSGPILTDAPFQTIGDNNISIPKRFYKAIYDPVNKKGVAFIMKNSYSQNLFSSFAVSIDELEAECNIDFFSDLDDEIEKAVESNFDKSEWDWEAIEKVYGE
jgi:endonuclease G